MHINRIADIRWGLRWGAGAFVFFAGWATLVRLASGDSPFEGIGTSYHATLALYAACGILGGLLLGAARPLTRSRVGAATVGWLLALMVYSGAGIMLGYAPWQWSWFFGLMIASIAAVVGIPGGIVHWKRHQNSA